MVIPKNKEIKWWQRETVRIRGYTIGTAVIGLFTLREYISNEEAGYILMALAAIMGVYGIESSRSVSTPDVEVEKVIEETKRAQTRWPYPADIRADDTAADYPDDYDTSTPKH